MVSSPSEFSLETLLKDAISRDGDLPAELLPGVVYGELPDGAPKALLPSAPSLLVDPVPSVPLTLVSPFHGQPPSNPTTVHSAARDPAGMSRKDFHKAKGRKIRRTAKQLRRLTDPDVSIADPRKFRKYLSQLQLIRTKWSMLRSTAVKTGYTGLVTAEQKEEFSQTTTQKKAELEAQGFRVYPWDGR